MNRNIKNIYYVFILITNLRVGFYMKYYKVIGNFGFFILLISFISMFEIFGGASLRTMRLIRSISLFVLSISLYMKQKL